jgi:hypothetical protein
MVTESFGTLPNGRFTWFFSGMISLWYGNFLKGFEHDISVKTIELMSTVLIK